MRRLLTAALLIPVLAAADGPPVLKREMAITIPGSLRGAVLSPDGGFCVGVSRFNGTAFISELLRYSSRGELLWQQQLPFDDFFSFGVDGTSVILLRFQSSGTTLQKRSLETGALLTERALPRASGGLGFSFGSAAGRRVVYVSQQEIRDLPGVRMATYAFDGETLAQVGSAFEGPAEAYSSHFASSVDRDGNVYVPSVSEAFDAYRLSVYSPGLGGKVQEASVSANLVMNWSEGAFTSASGMAVPTGGYLFFGSEDPAGPSFVFRKVSKEGEFQARVPYSALGSRVQPCGFDDNGNLVLFITNGLYKVDPQWQILWGPALPSLPGGCGIIQGEEIISLSNWYVDGLSKGLVFQRYGPETAGTPILSRVTSTEPVVGLTGNPLSSPLSVAATVDGQPQEGVGVTFTVTSSAAATGMAVSPAAAMTDAAGRASVTPTLGDIPGEYQVTAECAECGPAQSSVTFRCCGKLKTADYRQAGVLAPWANHQYDNRCYVNPSTPFDCDFPPSNLPPNAVIQISTIGKYGCALTAMATLISHYREIRPGVPTLTPAQVNDVLNEIEGYVEGNVDFTRISNQALSGGQITYFQSGSFDAAAGASLEGMISVVDQDLMNQKPVILVARRRAVMQNGSMSFGTHFLVAIGKCGGKYIVSDPGWGRTEYDPNPSSNPPYNDVEVSQSGGVRKYLGVLLGVKRFQ